MARRFGILHPELLVSTTLVDALTPEELDAAFAHEYAHVVRWDNLKRLAICVLPDPLSALPGGRRLERQWAAAAEHAADERVAWDVRASLALASALVKAARLPLNDHNDHAALASTLLGPDVIASRVSALVERRGAYRLSWSKRIFYSGVVAAAVIAPAHTYVMPIQRVHRVTEALFEDVLP